MDSPLLQSARGYGGGGRSPGVATLKEAFDITYAVHRMEEEGARRKGKGFLQAMDEEEEEDEDVAVVQAAKKRDDAAGGQLDKGAAHTQIYGGGRAGPRDRGAENKKGFELNMGGATLLGYASSMTRI